MSNSTNQKEQDVDYEPMAFTNFANPDSLPRSNKNKQNDNSPAIVLPTAAQLEEIQSQAHDEGYQAGFAEGAQRIAELLNALEQALQHSDQEIAQDLLNLSLEVAQTPMVNRNTKPTANSIGVSNVIEPFHMVAIQLNTFTPVGTAINMVAYMKNKLPDAGIPTVNMW